VLSQKNCTTVRGKPRRSLGCDRALCGSSLVRRRQAPPQRDVSDIRALHRPITTTSWFTTMRGDRCFIGSSDVANWRERTAEAGLASAERGKTRRSLDHSPESGVACLPRRGGSRRPSPHPVVDRDVPLPIRGGSRRLSPHPWWIATSLFPFVVDRDVPLPIRRGGSRRHSPHTVAPSDASAMQRAPR
jgi:hypothetical protein